MHDHVNQIVARDFELLEFGVILLGDLFADAILFDPFIFLQLLDVIERFLDGVFHVAKIDRLEQKIKSSPVHRGADVLHVAIGRNHDGLD